MRRNETSHAQSSAEKVAEYRVLAKQRGVNQLTVNCLSVLCGSKLLYCERRVVCSHGCVVQEYSCEYH